MSSKHLPDKETRCHRTGYQETCFRCVTEYGCRLWKRLELQADRASGQPIVEVYDCKDSHDDVYMKNIIGRLDTITGSIDRLRKEVQESNDAGMANALAGLNENIRRISCATREDVAALSHALPQKLIGST